MASLNDTPQQGSEGRVKKEQRRGPGGSAKNDKPLKDLTIKNLKPGTTINDVGENRGLRVTKSNSGVTTFLYRYRSPIKNDKGENPVRQFKIGTYPEISLNEARQKLTELKAKRDSGICPATEKTVERERQAEREIAAKEEKKQEAFTVEQCISDYLENHVDKNRKKKGAKETRRLLYADPVKKLGKKAVVNLTSEDVIRMINGVVDRGANALAGDMLRELTAAIDLAITDQLPSDFMNPCYQAKGLLQRRKVKLTSKRRDRVLNDGELAALLKWLPGSSYTFTQKNVLRLTLYTGCRTGEVCNAVWKDIDLDKGVWHLSETKTGISRDVQLSRQAVAFLEQLKHNTGEYPFPSHKTRLPIQQKQLTEQAWRMRQEGKFIDLPQWTPHDLRRTVRTGLARLRCPTEVAEAVLGHTKGGIEGVYNLHSYNDECGEWLQKWCDHLDELEASDKVVAMGVGRG